MCFWASEAQKLTSGCNVNLGAVPIYLTNDLNNYVCLCNIAQNYQGRNMYYVRH